MNNCQKTKTKTLCFDTLFRENYAESSSTDFEWILKEPLEKVVSMKLSALELPNMWYAISKKKKNNRFNVHLYNFHQLNEKREKYFIHEKKHTITIPDGNYRADYFEETMNTIFTNIKGGMDFLIVEVSEITSKTVIRCRNENDIGTNPNPYDITNDIYSPYFAYKIDFDVRDINIYQTLGWMMGYKEKEYLVGFHDIFSTYAINNNKNEKITYNGYLSSESSYGSSIYQYLYFVVEDNRNSLRLENVFSEMNEISENILARITISSSHNTVVMDNGSDLIFKKREYKAPVKIESFHFSILDKYGDIIDLNKNDYSFLLEFTLQT
jgi:hypothetical protein